MAHVRTRLSLVEYGTPVCLSDAIGEAIGIGSKKADQLLIDAGHRAASSLGLSYNPINVGPKGVRAIDFAGLIRLAPSLELEVAPKFLGLDDTDAIWREDFFYLATLSRHGRLLASERLAASGGVPRDLSTLVARALTSMYETRKRRPLRSYRRVKETDFFIDGDLDPMEIIFPTEDGFEQEVVRFDRFNVWNSDILAASRELLPEVTDPTAARALIRLIEDLAPQKFTANRRKAIPARHRAWKPLHELSLDVLRGLGLSYRQGHACAPGYLVATWRVWEDLLTVASRLGFGRSAVVPQKGFLLGSKKKLKSGVRTQLSVFPDCVIESEGDRPRLLLDAKYKGHVEKGGSRITESDLYEALAFSKASGCNRIVLAYPALPIDKPQDVGSCTVFEKIDVDDTEIVGIHVESRRISETGGLRAFAKNMAAGITASLRSE